MKPLRNNRRGQLLQIAADEYHARPEINPSSLAAGLVGPAETDVRAIRAALTGSDQSRAQSSQDRMDRGTAVHMMLLQPERLESDVAVWTGGRRSGGAWDEFQEEHAGKLVMRAQDFDQAADVYAAIYRHDMLLGALQNIHAEVAIITRDDRLPVRGMVDAIDLRGRRIVDIKTTDAGISHDQCERTIRSLKYREKMSCYRRWLARVTNTRSESWRCWNLFISMQPPYGIRLVEFTTTALEWGESRMLRALRAYRDALKADAWPLYAVRSDVDVAPWEDELMGGLNIDFAA